MIPPSLQTVVLLVLGLQSSQWAAKADLLLSEIQTAHPLWLRERCQSSWYADPDTKQPKYNLHEEVEALTVTNVYATTLGNQNGYQVDFSDGQSCFFPLPTIQAELQNQMNFLQVPEWNYPPMYLWDYQLQAPPFFEYDDIVSQNGSEFTDQTRKFLSVLISTGLAVVKNVPRTDGECVRFAEEFSSLRATEWGKQFNVRSTPDTASGGVARKDLAYTTKGIGMHVDSPYRFDGPPAYQLLHAIDHCHADSPDGCFVHNHFVDGFKVAQSLCETDRDLFDVLTKVILRWENNGGDDSSLLYRYAPIIELEPGNNDDSSKCPTVTAINFSAKSGGYAPNLPKEQLDLFYQAKRAFSAMLHDEKCTVRVQLFPGALVIFDNRRVLHSRSAIAPTDGERWLQGCYLTRDGINYLYEKLRRKYRSLTETPFRNLKEAPKADFDRMGVEYDEGVVEKTMDNLLALLENQKDAFLGAPVSLKEHNLQTASRALRGGEDDETVVISLFHDVFENLAVKNHGELISAMLAPWISPKSQWLLAHHEIFQGFYYFEFYGIDPNQRDMFKDHPFYNWTVTWCELYDQASFDPDYPTLPVEAFVPAVERVLARPQYWWNPSHPKAGAVSKMDNVISEKAETPNKTKTELSGKNVACADTWTCYGDIIVE